MATQNLKRIIKAVNANGIIAQVIPSPSNPLNSFKVICNGIEFKSSQWTSEDIENFVEFAQGKLSADCVAGVSVAKQKINTAHGTTVIKESENWINQLMTYADGVKSLIQLKGQSLNTVINAYMDLTENANNVMGNNLNYYKDWVESMKHWHDNAKIKVLAMLQNKEVFIMNEYVYSKVGMYNLIKNWFGENDIPTNDDKINSIIEKWVACYN